MKLRDQKIVDVGSFRNEHQTSWNKKVSLSRAGGVHRRDVIPWPADCPSSNWAVSLDIEQGVQLKEYLD